MQEVWKDVVGYEGLYQVSNLGQVKSLNYNHTERETILQQESIKTKQKRRVYIQKRINLWNNGKAKHFFVHRLVY